MPVVRSYLDFQELVVSPTMGADHFPDRYYYELLAVKNYFMASGVDL
jgi:hypothetical protein